MKIFSSIQKVLSFLESKEMTVNLSWRYSSESWCYDGNSIALMKHREYEDEDGRYLKVIYLEHDILHEIAHWIVASPDQRLFPEYGLAIGIVDCFALGTKNDGIRDENGIITNEARASNVFDGFLDWNEQTIQEFITQKISMTLGRMFFIDSNLSDFIGDWDQYEIMKKGELEKNSPEFIQEVDNRFKQICNNLFH